HTIVANGARSGRIRPRFQSSTSGPTLLFRLGELPSTPVAPWHPAHPFARYASAPSLTVPRPGGSSSPVGPMEISHARISSALGVRPTPYVGPCASAEPPMSNANAIGSTLRVPIGHAPVRGDPPGLHAVVQPRHAECFVEGLVPELGDLFARRLHLTDLVGAARQQLRLFSVPVPLIAETGMGHTLRHGLELGLVPFLAAVGGHFHLLDGAATGPGEAADLVEAFAGQLLPARRERDHGFRPDLVTECRFFRLLIEMSVIVVVHVVAVHHLDA